MRLLIPTNDPGATEAHYLALGYRTVTLYCKFAYPTLCDGHRYALSFWKPETEAQGVLL